MWLTDKILYKCPYKFHMKLNNRTDKRVLGDMGENVACMFMMKHGFEIIERNYLRKGGEIDIVAKKNGGIRFIEVKSVKHEGDWQLDLITVKIDLNTHKARVEMLENIVI